MKTITLCGEAYNKLDDFFDDVSGQLNFPAHFVHNIDVFQECLKDSATKEPVTIVWNNYAHARIVFGVSDLGVNYLPAVLNILSETDGVTLLLG